jgi:hypothetical protein
MSTEPLQAKLTREDLAQFTGTETWYSHTLTGLLYTDGVKHVATAGGAYWLIDTIAFAQIFSRLKRHEFQSWKLIVAENHTAVLTCEDGNGGSLYTQHFDFTSFPLEEISFFVTDNVLMLPGEY